MNKSRIIKDWDSKSLKKIPLSALEILGIFIKRNRNFLDSDEIQKALNIKRGKKLGARMAIFSKYDEEPLIKPVLKVSRTISRWAINKKYLRLIKERLKEVAPYLKK